MQDRRGNAFVQEQLGAALQPLDPFPHRAAIEASFGIAIAGRAVVDAEGTAARGAEAFTDGDTVHFADATPSLAVAAHEATHLLHHAGKAADGGMGAEAHAETIAEQVVQGKPADMLLGGKGAPAPAGRTHAYTKAAKQKPVAIYGYFAKDDGKGLAAAIEKSGLPKDTEVYFGSYGLNQTTADDAHSIPGGKYAPLFDLVRTKSPALYEGRAKGVKGESKYAGAVPTVAEILAEKKSGKIKNAQYTAYKWGLEVGRRNRDKIREQTGKGMKIDAWHFDEVFPSVSKELQGDAAVTREYIRGAIVGLAMGRPAMEDTMMKGIVEIAHFVDLVNLGNGGEMKKFWTSLAKCTDHVVGEEYPAFSGGKAGAEKAAARQDGAVDKLATYGKAGKSVAGRYVAGLTPGFIDKDAKGRKVTALGGRQAGQTTAEADQWRESYINARAKDGVAGFSEYNWMGDNPKHEGKVTKDVAAGVKKLT
jgi:hypothetical protein